MGLLDMSPTLTAIVPVYNGMPFLKETVESLLNQTYQDFQLLIVDDGSTDGSRDYLKSIDDPRLDLIFNAENQGLCRSLNQGILHHAKSDLIARLDQDDLALPSRLAEQFAFMQHHPHYAGVLCQVSRIGAKGQEFGYYLTPNSQSPIEDYHLDRYGFIVHSTFMFRRQQFLRVGGYRSSLYPVDDVDLLLRLWEKYPLAVINKPLVKYRIHSQASSFNTFWMMQNKTRYALEMHHHRQQGMPELTFDDWMDLDKTPLLPKILRYKNEFGQLMFRNAGRSFGEGKKISGGLFLLSAFFSNPHFTTQRLLALRKPTPHTTTLQPPSTRQILSPISK